MSKPAQFISGYLKTLTLSGWAVRYLEQNKEHPTLLEIFTSEGKNVKKATIDLTNINSIEISKSGSKINFNTPSKNWHFKLIPLGVNVPRTEFSFWIDHMSEWLDYFVSEDLSAHQRGAQGWVKEDTSPNILNSLFSLKKEPNNNNNNQNNNNNNQNNNNNNQNNNNNNQNNNNNANSLNNSQGNSKLSGSSATNDKSPLNSTSEKSLIDTLFPKSSPPTTGRNLKKETENFAKATKSTLTNASNKLGKLVKETQSSLPKDSLKSRFRSMSRNFSTTKSSGSDSNGPPPVLTPFQTPDVPSAPEVRNTPDVEEIALALKRGSSWGERDIPWEDIEELNDIGSGNFGIVKLGIWRNTQVAIKRVRGELLQGKARGAFISEIHIMRSLRPHPNVAQYIGLCYEPLCLITLYYSNGSLYNYLRERGMEFSFGEKLKIMRGIAVGIDHLHKEKLIHRDIAARNILLDENLNPCVSDFGLGRYLTTGNGGSFTEDISGAVRWMAPECFDSENKGMLRYSTMTDMYSYGVTCWEILTDCLRQPFSDINTFQVPVAVTQGKRLTVPAETPQWFTDLIKSTWDVAPKRPSFFKLITELENHSKEKKVIGRVNSLSALSSWSERASAAPPSYHFSPEAPKRNSTKGRVSSFTENIQYN